MDRITQKDLEQLCNIINRRAGSTDGMFYIDGAYGGVKLVQVVGEHGGIREVSRNGYSTKRNLYNWMGVYLVYLELHAARDRILELEALLRAFRLGVGPSNVPPHGPAFCCDVDGCTFASDVWCDIEEHDSDVEEHKAAHGSHYGTEAANV